MYFLLGGGGGLGGGGWGLHFCGVSSSWAMSLCLFRVGFRKRGSFWGTSYSSYSRSNIDPRPFNPKS